MFVLLCLQFNTLNSEQILGFTEAIGGVHIRLQPRKLLRSLGRTATTTRSAAHGNQGAAQSALPLAAGPLRKFTMAEVRT